MGRVFVSIEWFYVFHDTGVFSIGGGSDTKNFDCFYHHFDRFMDDRCLIQFESLDIFSYAFIDNNVILICEPPSNSSLERTSTSRSLPIYLFLLA